VNLEQVEQELRQRLDALGPAPRAELPHVLMLPDVERADRSSKFWGQPAQSRPVSPCSVGLASRLDIHRGKRHHRAMAAEVHPGRGRGFSVGYMIVLLGAALFVTGCFLPYYGFPGGRSLSLYDQLLVLQDGGLELSAILFLFGGVATVVVVAILALTRGERQSGRGFLAGAVSAWSLTWIGSLLQTASLRETTIPPEGLSLAAGFWLQAVGIGVTVIGTILVATRRTGAHERDAAGLRV
jgi:hypothetical protein